MATDFTVDRDTVKYVLNSSGDIASVAIDTPAIEYNTDGTYKGLLVEPASTNLCLQSEDLSTTWLDDSTSLQQASTEETPDGDTSSKNIKLVDTSAGGTGGVYLYQTITVSGGTKYTASVFVKKSGLDWVAVQANGTGGSPDANPTQYFDLTNGVTGTASAGIQDSTIEAYPNGWYRCSITWTQGAAGTSFIFIIYVAEADGVANVVRDGTRSIFVWGAQVEASPIATSYIPTTTASVTRNKDDINLTGASDLIGQSEGTFYIEVDWRVQSGLSQRIMQIANSGAITDTIDFYRYDPTNSIRFQVTVDVSEEQNLQSSYTGNTGIKKIAVAYKTSDTKIFLDGSVLASTTLGDLSNLNMDDIFLGQTAFGGGQFNMWIRAVALYKTRLTDDQLADLTS